MVLGFGLFENTASSRDTRGSLEVTGLGHKPPKPYTLNSAPPRDSI